MWLVVVAVASTNIVAKTDWKFFPKNEDGKKPGITLVELKF